MANTKTLIEEGAAMVGALLNITNPTGYYLNTRFTFGTTRFFPHSAFFFYLYRSQETQNKQSTYKCNTEERSRNHCCRVQAISITYFHRVPVTFVIQHRKRMRHIALSSVARPTVQYFSTLSQKR